MKIKALGNFSHADRPPVILEGRYEFTYDPACTDYDWLVVFDELPGDDRGTFRNGYEPLACPRERTILCTWEPVTIKTYSRVYTRQFGHLLSNRPADAEKHPHYHLGRGYFFWFSGRNDPVLAAKAVIPPKTRMISAVCSAKQMCHTAHHARFRLIKTLAAEIQGFDWFGHGVRHIDRKYEALDAYRYHVAVENHIAVHHWTEKIADAWLSECLPFYAGDPDLAKIVPAESFIPIPLDDAKEAVRIIQQAIAEGAYEKRRAAILEAKRLMLVKYNFWSQVVDVIKSAEAQPVTPVNAARPFRLYGRKALRTHSLGALVEDGWAHLRQLVLTGRC